MSWALALGQIQTHLIIVAIHDLSVGMNHARIRVGTGNNDEMIWTTAILEDGYKGIQNLIPEPIPPPPGMRAVWCDHRRPDSVIITASDVPIKGQIGASVM